jgi:hypothetical protein
MDSSALKPCFFQAIPWFLFVHLYVILFRNLFELINILHLWQLLYHMDNSFFGYLQRLELMAFFSAYPLIYTIIYVVTSGSKKEFLKKLPSLLPYTYALVGTLCLGLQLKNLYPDYSFENIRHSVQQPFLTIWALFSLLSWIPLLAKKPFISLLHSLVFFFFLVQDLFLQFFSSSADKNIVRNDMKIYTDSLLLNGGAFILVTLIFLLISRFTKQK